MKLKRYIKNLEKKRIISKAPHPIIPFLLGLLIYLLSIWSNKINYVFGKLFLYLAIFTFIFAIIHLIVYKILTSNKTR